MATLDSAALLAQCHTEEERALLNALLGRIAPILPVTQEPVPVTPTQDTDLEGEVEGNPNAPDPAFVAAATAPTKPLKIMLTPEQKEAKKQEQAVRRMYTVIHEAFGADRGHIAIAFRIGFGREPSARSLRLAPLVTAV